jgi:hypothetical protein
MRRQRRLQLARQRQHPVDRLDDQAAANGATGSDTTGLRADQREVDVTSLGEAWPMHPLNPPN